MGDRDGSPTHHHAKFSKVRGAMFGSGKQSFDINNLRLDHTHIPKTLPVCAMLFMLGPE